MALAASVTVISYKLYKPTLANFGDPKRVRKLIITSEDENSVQNTHTNFWYLHILNKILSKPLSSEGQI